MKTLTAFYDLAVAPVSCDFVTQLVQAMKKRDELGCDSLHMVIVPKEAGLGGFARHWGQHDEHATRWRLWHIITGACPLGKATLTIAADRRQAERLRVEPCWWPEKQAHHVGPLIEAGRRGERIPPLQASEAARRYVGNWVNDERPLVTMTLRHQETVSVRNSRRAAWETLADELSPRFGVVVLEDTHQALQAGFGGYGAIDMDLRLALYERAAMNLFGDNGPSILTWFSEAPFLRFCCGADPEHWTKHMALSLGDQLPWASNEQRLVWGPDDLETMRAVFADWEAVQWAGATS